MKPDFSGYATKAGLKCSDGRTITPDAFKHMDGLTVPLVWSHKHDDPDKVLGHVILKHVNDGMRVDGYFNNTRAGQTSKTLVDNGDVDSLSIFANQLVEKAKSVLHGMIREVSLVLAGANPGAKIDQIAIRHSDGTIEELDEEAIIYTGLKLFHVDSTSVDEEDDADETDEIDGDEDDDEAVEHADGGGDLTIQDVYDAMTDEEKAVVHYMVGVAAKGTDTSAAHSDGNDEGALEHQEGTTSEMTRNVFENGATGGTATQEPTLSHDAMAGIFQDARRRGSLKDALNSYALKHGIDNIDVLFPDAKNIDDTPQLNKRRTEWVENVLGGTRHTPFSRIKTIVADITMASARALGYIKGSLKKEEWFGVTKRTTTPTTVYKKQKLDRDDILDITDFNVVTFMKAEMGLMLREELARAILVGDGRDVLDDDKILDPAGASSGPGIRSILNDHELYVTTLLVNIDDASSSYDEAVDEIFRGMRFYKGSGSPTFYSTRPLITEMLLTKDGFNQRKWKNKQELADAMGVGAIVEVEVMEDSVAYPNLLGIVVNLADYNVGTDQGGEINMFDFFDLDYNQQKYLLETRMSGALVKIKSALVLKKTAAANVLVVPTAPSFVEATGVITIPTKTGVTYHDTTAGGATLTAGAQTALAVGASKTVVAVPAAGYYFESNAEDQWTFERP